MAENQKIAFLCHPYHRGGVTRWMADAAIAFAERGYTVYFITIEPAKEFVSAKGNETLLHLLGKRAGMLHVVKTKAGSEFELGTTAYRAFVYKKLLRQLPLGIPVILSDDETVWSAATAMHQSYPIIGVLHADEAYYYNLAAKYARYVDSLVCVSERVRKTVMQYIPDFNPARIYTIPCGINLPPLNKNTSSEQALKLIYVGRVLHYQKRVGDLVKIGALLAQKNIPFHLTVIGQGNAIPDLENSINAAGLQRHISLAGWMSQEEVARHLSDADILVLTSDFEGTPIAMMEALASGCCFIGTRVSGIEDYEHHPMAANCFSVYDIGDIAGAVKNIIKIAAIPPDIRKSAARQLAESEFTMQTCLNRYSKVIASVKPADAPAQSVTLPVLERLSSRLIALARYYKVSFMS